MNFPAFVIDTSTAHQLFARLDADGVGSVKIVPTEERAENSIDENFSVLFGEISDVREIWLGQGPGSFVGLRSSFAYVRMLATLSGVECRTFFSSRLWRSIFSVPAEDWFLMRTNARLYYADQFSPEREAMAIDAEAARTLEGKIHCFRESWKSAKSIRDELPGRELVFRPENVSAEMFASTYLQPSKAVAAQDLNPLYGHELNFVKKGNYG